MQPSLANRIISFSFTAVVIVALGSFLALGAYSPATFSRGVFGVVPVSVVLAAGLIVGAVVLTALYVVIANGRAR